LLAQGGQTKVPELTTDRPDRTESSAVVPKGFIQAELGWEFARDQIAELRTDKQQFPATLIRLGIFSRAEFRFEWEGGFWEKNMLSGERQTSNGPGDNGIGTKVFLWEECEWIPESALITGVSLPTGKDGFSTERFDPFVRLAMSNQLTERLGLGYNVAVDWESFLETSSDRDTRPSFAYSVVLGIALNGRSSIFVEIFGRAPVHSSGTSRISADTGFTYLVLGNLQFDMSTGMGLSSSAPDWFLGGGVSFRLPK
ncbi:MAG: transporter, partial [bacterium]